MEQWQSDQFSHKRLRFVPITSYVDLGGSSSTNLGYINIYHRLMPNDAPLEKKRNRLRKGKIFFFRNLAEDTEKHYRLRHRQQ